MKYASTITTFVSGAAVAVAIAAVIIRRNKKTMAASSSSPTPTTRQLQKIAVTGGPCSGKTSGMQHLSAMFKDAGFDVLVVPEVATLLFDAGVDLRCATSEQCVLQQTVVLSTMLHLEDALTMLSSKKKASHPIVILCDRAAMDGKAYCTDAEWRLVLENTSHTNHDLCSRYDVVVHLVTAADGAPDAYNYSNHARREGLQEARDVDDKVRAAWSLYHGRRFTIDNSTGFEEKMRRAFQCISQCIC
jgi:thymidylate kinase